MAAPKTGHQCKLYKNTGTDAAPTVVLLDGVTDVMVPQLPINTAQLQVRGENRTLILPSIGDVVTMSFRWVPGYNQTVYNALVVDYLAQTPRQYAVFSGAYNDSAAFGWVLPMIIKNMPLDQTLLQVQGSEIELEGVAYMEESGSVLDIQWFDDVTSWGAGT